MKKKYITGNDYYKKIDYSTHVVHLPNKIAKLLQNQANRNFRRVSQEIMHIVSEKVLERFYEKEKTT